MNLPDPTSNLIVHDKPIESRPAKVSEAATR